MCWGFGWLFVGCMFFVCLFLSVLLGLFVFVVCVFWEVWVVVCFCFWGVVFCVFCVF